MKSAMTSREAVRMLGSDFMWGIERPSLGFSSKLSRCGPPREGRCRRLDQPVPAGEQHDRDQRERAGGYKQGYGPKRRAGMGMGVGHGRLASAFVLPNGLAPSP